MSIKVSSYLLGVTITAVALLLSFGLGSTIPLKATPVPVPGSKDEVIRIHVYRAAAAVPNHFNWTHNGNNGESSRVNPDPEDAEKSNQFHMIFDSLNNKQQTHGIGGDKDRNVHVTLDFTSNSTNITSLEHSQAQGISYHLVCFAPFIVEWIYNGYGVPNGKITNQKLRTGKLLYVSKIVFRGSPGVESNSGSYTCSSTTGNNNSDSNSNNLNLRSRSLQIFFMGNRVFLLDSMLESMRSKFLFAISEDPGVPGYLEKPDQEEVVPEDLHATSCDKGFCKVFHLTIHFHTGESEENWLTFPCGISKPLFSPKSDLLLYVINKTTNSWRYLQLNRSNLTFNPNAGFKLNVNTSELDLLNQWKNLYFICASNHIKTLINITVSPNPNPEPQRSTPTSTSTTTKRHVLTNVNTNLDLRSNGMQKQLELYFNSSSEEFVCKWPKSAGRVATVGLVPCFSMTHCQFTKAGLENSYRIVGQLGQGHGYSAGKVKTYSESIQNDSYNDFMQTRKPTEYSFMSSGLFYCVLLETSSGRRPDEPEMDTILFYKLKQSVFVLPKEETMQVPATNDILELTIIRDELEETDNIIRELEFSCIGSSMFLAEPFTWKIVYSNGTKLLGQPGRMRTNLNNGIISSRFTLIFEPHAHSSNSNTSIPISIECHAPIWNSMDQIVYLEMNLKEAVEDIFSIQNSSETENSNPAIVVVHDNTNWASYAFIAGFCIVYICLIVAYASLN